MSFDVSLSDINVGMPHTRGDMYAQQDQAVYLIKVRHRDPVLVLIIYFYKLKLQVLLPNLYMNFYSIH